MGIFGQETYDFREILFLNWGFRFIDAAKGYQPPSSVKQHLKRNTHSALASKGKGRCKVEVWGSATEEDISCVSVS